MNHNFDYKFAMMSTPGNLQRQNLVILTLIEHSAMAMVGHTVSDTVNLFYELSIWPNRHLVIFSDTYMPVQRILPPSLFNYYL